MTKSDSDDSCCCKFVAASRLRISEFSRTLARPVSQVLICDTTASVIRFFFETVLECWGFFCYTWVLSRPQAIAIPAFPAIKRPRTKSTRDRLQEP